MLKKTGLAVLLLCFIYCNSTAQTTAAPGAHVIVYKTRGDYRQLVPIMLSADGKTIISYPDPQDLSVRGANALPTKLHKGYLLDNRGIGKNVAFLDYTYKQYSNLKAVPTREELYKHIKIAHPLVFYWDCGNRAAYKNIVSGLNQLIDKDELKNTCSN